MCIGKKGEKRCQLQILKAQTRVIKIYNELNDI